MYMRKVLCNDRSSFLEKVKIMFTEFDEFLLTCGYFKIRNWNIDSAEVISIDSGHYWIIKKFDKEGLELLKAEAAYGEAYGISASPTFLWEGKVLMDFGTAAQIEGFSFLVPSKARGAAAAPTGSC